MTFPLLTKRLEIDTLGLADLDAFVSYRQDPDVARFQSWESTYSSQQANELIQSQEGLLWPLQGQWLQLALHDRETRELVGDLALHALEGNAVRFEIGFTIAPRHQRNGFASEAAASLIAQLFSRHGATEVIAHSDRRNVASIKLLLALGFQTDPSKSWNEQFKGEEVTVDYFFKKNVA